MTQALSAAVASAAKLPDEEQNVLAAILLEEMESEERWSALFAGSQNLLQQMASEAIQDFQAGRVQPIDELQLTQLRLISSESSISRRLSKGDERSGAPTNSGKKTRPILPSDSRRSIQRCRSIRPVSISTGVPSGC